ncbi:COP9 signalosome (CSN) subunit [Coemansia sp. RSA 2399]|nr:COP9 signalosome (CSN) subunit [Coemansia sp. RSA 2399]KAJ1892402.1 COP9 signalosome (CSN) subunit [Coemansia sp. IMI 209127]
MSGMERLKMALHKFRILKQVKGAEELAQVIANDSVYTKSVLDDIWLRDGCWDVLFVEEKKKRSLWDEMTVQHFQAAAAYQRGDFTAAYKHRLAMCNSFLREFPNMSRWGVFALFVISNDLSDVAQHADRQQPPPFGDPHARKIEEATRTINQGFSLCMTDREPLLSKSRKWGTYHMANILFKLYLRLKAYNLCNSMIRAIKTSELPSLDRFPMGDQVTFRFHRGMLAFRGEKYSLAKDDLLFALEHCHRDAFRNKTRILLHLAPIMMMEGLMPASRLFRRYPPIKALYGNLAKAAKSGNLGQFDSLLREKEQQLAAIGTYTATEQVRKVAVRQLLYKVYLVESKATRIPFSLFRAGFAAAGIPNMELAEVECILADMVFGGYVKGYLAHDHGIAVLSKQTPFPPIRSLYASS